MARRTHRHCDVCGKEKPVAGFIMRGPESPRRDWVCADCQTAEAKPQTKTADKPAKAEAKADSK